MAKKDINFILKAQDKTSPAFKSATKNTDKLSSSAKSLKGVIAGIGFAFVAKQVIDFSRNTFDAADAIGKSADRIGISTDVLQKYAFAFDKADVAQENLNKGLLVFGKRLGKAHQGIGALVGGLKGGEEALLAKIKATTSVNEALKITFKAIGDATTQTRKLAIADAAFGTVGLKMTAAFNEGTAAFEENMRVAERLGLVLDESLIRNAEKLNDEFSIASDVIGIQFKAAILEMAPLMISFAKDIITLGEAMALLTKPSTLAWWDKAASVFGAAINGLYLWNSEMLRFETGVKFFQNNQWFWLDRLAEGTKESSDNIMDLTMNTRPAIDAAREHMQAEKERAAALKKARQPMTSFLEGLKNIDLQEKEGIITSEAHIQKLIKLEEAFARATQAAKGVDFNVNAPFDGLEDRLTEKRDQDFEATFQRNQMIAEQALAPQRDFTEGVELLQKQLDLGVIGLEGFDNKMMDLANNYGVAVGKMEKDVSDFAQSAQGVLEQGFASAFKSILSGGEELELSFAGILASIGNMMADILAQKAAAAIIEKLPFASGGVIDKGQVIPFASGGIVNRPTVFKMANGMGLMGEAGPEAIVPLGRIGGKLGINASGMGKSIINNIKNIINVNIDNSGNARSAGDQKTTGSEIAEQIEGVVVSVIQKQMRPGGRLQFV